MKRKVEKQEVSASRSAVSAIAARRARLQQQQQEQEQQNNQPSHETQDNRETQPPAKKVRSFPGVESKSALLSDREKAKIDRLDAPVKAISEDLAFELSNIDTAEVSSHVSNINRGTIVSDQVGGEENADVQDSEDEVVPSRLATTNENFTISRYRLRKSDVVYSDEHILCVRLREKTTMVLIGVYDIWVKRGVISLMGAKIHPSPKTYRVYAPSTHSLPVIKCVTAVEGYAEIEFQSCSSDLYRLKNLSPHYSRIWNSSKTVGDDTTLNGSYKRSFSILYTSSDDPLRRPLRPLHLEKKWSTTVKSLSHHSKSLRILICGPKGAGKSTFGRYLLNHLLTPPPQTGGGPDNSDGIAFLDLDPGQPEFAPMGNIYLAHLREPCFGPPYSHPKLDNSRYGRIIRCHHIGATSPKEDPDNYALAIMNLLDQYRILRTSNPRCPLIINFPGWIFGLGLEIATWLIRTAGLSDVVYMSEKGPAEVVEPLGYAASEAGVTLTTLPSQPVDTVTRSSAQLRAMQMQSYFHMIQPEGVQDPFWSDSPLIHNGPICVNYAGPQAGISGVMVLGNRYDPKVLKDILDGSIVAVVAIEDASAIPGSEGSEAKKDGDSQIEEDFADTIADTKSDSAMSDIEDVLVGKKLSTEDSQRIKDLLDNSTVRCPNSALPYLYWGAGSSTPLDPKASRCLGLAYIRSVDVSSHKLELISPIPSSCIQESVKRGQTLVFVRGMTDSPDWVFSEEYYAARNAEQDHIASLSQAKKNRRESDNGLKEKSINGGNEDDTEQEPNEHLRRLQERVRRASRMPYLKVIDEASALHSNANRQENGTWKLRKKVYISSDSELD